MKVFYFAENINLAVWSSIVTSPMLNIECTSLSLKVWPYHIMYIIRQLCKMTCVTVKVHLFCLLAFPYKYCSYSHKLIAFCWFTIFYWWMIMIQSEFNLFPQHGIICGNFMYEDFIYTCILEPLFPFSSADLILYKSFEMLTSSS